MISVIIPVYKQKELFLTNLAHNLPFFSGHEVIIVNDDPETQIKNEVAKLFTEHSWPDSSYSLVEHSKNQGFSASVNDGVARAAGDYILLLNTDVVLHDQSWERAESYLQSHPQIFAVGFAQHERNGALVGRNAIYFKSGLFHHKALSFSTETTVLSTAWAEGGSSLFRKSMWRLLGGFDIAYSPFYWEDVDLGYRARLRGWESVFDPAIRVDHQHGGTTTAHFHTDQVKSIAYQHQLYFTKKFAKGAQKVAYYLYLLKRMLGPRSGTST